MGETRKISLVIADVDGTLMTDQKTLSERTIAAVRALRGAGIRFAITSGRPPRGMAMLVQPLTLDEPIAAFNGGVFVRPDLSLLEQRVLEAELVRDTLQLIRGHGLDAWLYTATDWLVTDPAGPHVAREARAVQFQPTVVPNFDGMLNGIAKIVGISDDPDLVAQCDQAAQSALRGRASASRSQPYYLDVTHKNANKGAVVDYLAARLQVATQAIATIGDSANDVWMFRRSGLSIAMGNASEQVKAQATVTTESNQADGFAGAMERFILNAT